MLQEEQTHQKNHERRHMSPPPSFREGDHDWLGVAGVESKETCIAFTRDMAMSQKRPIQQSKETLQLD